MWKGNAWRRLAPLGFAFITIVCVMEIMGTGPLGDVMGSGGGGDFSADVEFGEDYEVVLDEHVDEGELPQNYSWRVVFGDGGVSSWLGPGNGSVEHSYHHAGTYEVYLEVRDDAWAGVEDPGDIIGADWSGGDGAGEDGAAGDAGGGEVPTLPPDDALEDGGWKWGPGIVLHEKIETLKVHPRVDPTMRILTMVVFVAAYAGIITEKIDRTIVAMGGATLMVVMGIFDEADIGQYISWETLGLIFGMFTMVTVLAESGFFRWIGLHTLRHTRFIPIRVFILFSGMGAFLSAFMDSITVLLFMATLTLEVCRILDIKPTPFLIAEITSANIGGSSTMVGDPPNIIIGTGLGYSFTDFVYHTGPIAVIVFFANLGFFLLWHRRFLRPKKSAIEKIRESHMDLDPGSAINDPYMMWVSLAVFIFAVGLLVVHDVFDISVALIGFLGASLTLLLAGRKKMVHMLEKIDWGTLLFFGGLFVLVGGLEATGVLREVANEIAELAGDNIWLLLLLILWMSAFMSAFVDNVPFAATMVPVLRELSNQGFSQHQMAYTLALGADVGGNGTPIGASANVVGLSVAKRNGLDVSWGEYMKTGMTSMIFCMVIITGLIFIAVETGWW